MKFVTMSLATAMLMGASAYAMENVKADGGVAVFYESVDEDFNNGVTSLIEGSVNAGFTADIPYGMTFGFRGYMTTSFGIDVTDDTTTWSDSLAGDPTAAWLSELYVSKSFDNTAVTVGRMLLETPLVFTETWNTAPNSFAAAMLTNTDLPETTLAAAYIDSHNGSLFTVAEDGEFGEFGVNGAYTLAAINNSFKPLTAQVWFYDVIDVATAIWAQAEFTESDFLVGVQYGTMSADEDFADTDDATAMAVKLGYDGIENLSIAAAYSTTEEDSALNFNNVSTGFQSPLYTEAWWYMGYVSTSGVDAVSAMAEYSMPDIADFGVYFVSAENDEADTELTELVVTATKTIYGVDATVAYVGDDLGDAGDDTRLQLYLSTSF